jgi:ribonuclease Z
MGAGSASLQAGLVNGTFGDPGVFVDFAFERRALLFDLGDLAPLAVKKLLRVTDAFVSHAHMDHFVGFDRLLRTCLGRSRPLRLFGPPGILAQVEAKLAAYTWDRAYGIEHDFAIHAIELAPEGNARAAWFRCSRQFGRENAEAPELPAGAILDEPRIRIRTAFLDHRTPSMAFALEEREQVHVKPEALAELGLAPGPWLSALKAAVAAGATDNQEFCARWSDEGVSGELRVPLGEIRRRALAHSPGLKLAYVTDALYSEANAERIVSLAAGADLLFIETVFADEDEALGRKRCHLTAGQAGRLARAAGAKAACQFHFSPRYKGREELLRRQFAEAFGSVVMTTSPAASPPHPPAAHPVQDPRCPAPALARPTPAGTPSRGA